MEISVYQADVFTTKVNQGNPAGIVPAADNLTTDQMQKIAAEMGFNETVFILPSEECTAEFRYFTPGHETPLCGHATIGGVRYLLDAGLIQEQALLKTEVGPIEIKINADALTMAQSQPKQTPFLSSKKELCNILNIQEEDLLEDLPIEYGNTGSWTLLVPVKNEAVLAKMVPQTLRFPEVLKEIPHSSIHPFTVSNQEQRLFSARHFSSPYSKTIEDPVTGTASGVMAAYSQRYLYPEKNPLTISIQQGRYLKRPGQLLATATKEAGKTFIEITGTAIMNPQVKKINL